MNGYTVLGGGEMVPADIKGVPSVCGVILGGPQPYRGLIAGAVEVVAALFFPTPLRIVVGTIGLLRVAYGLARISGSDPKILASLSKGYYR